MSIEKCLDELRSIQAEFLEFIEDDENDEEKFRNLCLVLDNTKIRDNKHNLSLFLHHVASVCANHHRNQNFFCKIERVLRLLKDDLKKHYINSEILNIFKCNKRILLFMIEEKMIIIDDYVVKKIIETEFIAKNYPQYFAPEIKPFLSEKWFPKYDPKNYFLKKNTWIEDIEKELPENFYELRKKGENDSYICELIREDSVEDFIAYVNRFCISSNANIDSSIYETNSFLIKMQSKSDSKKGIRLIEYAAFFGSIQIIKYLEMQGAELTSSLWLYVIHSQNAELIHFLEDCHIEPRFKFYRRYKKVEEKSYEGCFKESIKCNHNAFADYFLNNYLQNGDQISKRTFLQNLKYYNFGYIKKEHVNEESSLCKICKYDYYLFTYDLLKNKAINDIEIKICIIKYNFIKQHYIWQFKKKT